MPERGVGGGAAMKKRYVTRKQNKNIKILKIAPLQAEVLLPELS
jgi:hypothetical protein